MIKSCAVLFRALGKKQKPQDSLEMQNFKLMEAELLNQSFVWVDGLTGLWPALMTCSTFFVLLSTSVSSAYLLTWILPSSKGLVQVPPAAVMRIKVLHKYIFISLDCPHYVTMQMERSTVMWKMRPEEESLAFCHIALPLSEWTWANDLISLSLSACTNIVHYEL